MVLTNPAGIAYGTVAVVFAAVAVLSWRRRAHSRSVALCLALAMGGAFIWAVADLVQVGATDPHVVAVAALTIFPGVSGTVAAFVFLALCIARPQWVPTRRIAAAVLVEPILVTVTAATNPWHLLLYSGPGADRLSDSASWLHGPAFWVHTGYCYLALAFGMALIARAWWKAPAVFRPQHLTMLVGAMIPLGANVLHLAGAFGPLADPTLLGFALTGTMIARAIFRQDLFTFSPVGRALIVDQIGDAIAVLDPSGRILDLNSAARVMVSSLRPDLPADLIGRRAKDVFVGITSVHQHPDGWDEIAVALPAGTVEMHVRSYPLVDFGRGAHGRIYVARDVTEANAQARALSAANARLVRQVETIERLRTDLVELASRDPLTGLHNRRHLVDRFEALLAASRSTCAPLTVILIDVDRFKSVNDRYGHLVGDEVLIALAHRIRAHTPPGALVARWGGEEFFLALPGADTRAGTAVAEDLRARCERDGIDAAGTTIRCTLSIGVATYPTSGATMNDLFHAADRTLYEAKNAGRNTVKAHHAPPTPQLPMTDRSSAQTLLR